MNRSICFAFLIACIVRVRTSCFGNSSTPNSTISPCLVNGGAFLPHQLPPALFPNRPSPYYQHTYPQDHPYGYRTAPQFPQQQLPGSNVLFPQSGYQTEYNPYYRPNDLSRVGYSYPSGYRGPQMEWNHYYPPQYSNHLGQPPPRYTLGHGHPNFSPVSPIFQRRTYASDYRQSQWKEPLYQGRGTVAFVGRDAELSCSFYDTRYKVVSNVAWVKVTGPYEYGSLHPPFECHRPGCNYIYLNSYNDFRFRVITLGQTSTLRIYDYTPADQGIYRCAATAQAPDGQTVTVYKITDFFANVNSQRQSYAGRL